MGIRNELTVFVMRCFHAEMKIPNIRMISSVKIRKFRNQGTRILCKRVEYQAIDTSKNNLNMLGSMENGNMFE